MEPATVGSQSRELSQHLETAAQKREQFAVSPAPPRLRRDNGQVQRQRAQQGAPGQRSTSGATAPTRGSANASRAASAQPEQISVSSLSNSTTSPRDARRPALAARQNPPRCSRRSRRTPANSAAAPTAPSGEASS